MKINFNQGLMCNKAVESDLIGVGMYQTGIHLNSSGSW